MFYKILHMGFILLGVDKYFYFLSNKSKTALSEFLQSLVFLQVQTSRLLPCQGASQEKKPSNFCYLAKLFQVWGGG